MSTELVSPNRTCPRCGTVGAGSRWCPGCGLNLDIAEPSVLPGPSDLPMPAPPKEAPPHGQKICPYCAETIQPAAIKCKHCGSDLVPERADRAAAPQIAAQSRGLTVDLDEAKRAFRCPKCGSSIVDFQHRRFDYKAAVGGAVGAVIAGAVLGGAADVVPIGAVAGFSDGKQLEFKCQSCGHADLFRKGLQQTGQQGMVSGAAQPEVSQKQLANGNTLHYTSFSGLREGEYSVTAPDGHVTERGTFVNGAVAGTVLGYHPDGSVSSRATWVNNKRHGPMEAFHPNGAIKARGEYNFGLAQGVHERFSEAGHLLKRSPFENGKLNGTFEAFHPDGRPAQRVEYAGGKKNGVQESFDEGGKLTQRIRWRNDKLDTDADQTLAPHGFDDAAVEAFKRGVVAAVPAAASAFLVRRLSSGAPVGWMLVIALSRRIEPKAAANRRVQDSLAKAMTAAWPVPGDQLLLRVLPSDRLVSKGFAEVPGARILGRDG